MLMPLVSVTSIGLVAAAVALLLGRRTVLGAGLRGLLGAWGGFVLGAVAGVLVDVLAGNGVYLPIVGHFGAVVGAAWALSRREQGSAVVRAS